MKPGAGRSAYRKPSQCPGCSGMLVTKLLANFWTLVCEGCGFTSASTAASLNPRQEAVTHATRGKSA